MFWINILNLSIADKEHNTDIAYKPRSNKETIVSLEFEYK